MRARFARRSRSRVRRRLASARAADDVDAKVKAADAAKGAQVFAQYCATCHGPRASATDRSARR